MSKGSKQRPTNQKAFDNGYELAFGKRLEPSQDYNNAIEAVKQDMDNAGQVMQEITETITTVHTLQ